VAENKKQHYVPKSVLKNFASDPSQKQINLINISRKKIIRRASLRDQCYRDYLYGKELAVEKELAKLEGHFKSLTVKLMQDHQMNIDLHHRLDVVSMIALQKARTLRAEEEINFMVDKIMKMMMHGHFTEDELKKFKVGLTHAANMNVATALTVSPMLLDLKQFLIINKSKIPFIISDNPVVMTNWFCRARMPARSSGGFSRSGLQIFMPLSPECALMLHDSGVYNAESANNVISISQSSEVSSLNELQWLNAYKNIYFSEGLTQEEITSLLSTVRPERGAVSFQRLESVDDPGLYRATDKTEFDSPSEGVRSELVHVSANGLPKDIRLRSLRIRSKPTFYDNGSAASPARDPVWREIVEEFAKAVQAQVYSFGDLWSFLDRHPLVAQIGSWHRKLLR
jgi:hypothetical protein